MDYDTLRELAVSVDLDTTVTIAADSGKFPTNLTKAIHDAVKAELEHKFTTPESGTSRVAEELAGGDCCVDMSTAVLLHASLAGATVVDPSRAALPTQYALDLLSHSEHTGESSAFPGGIVDSESGKKHTALFLMVPGETSVKLDHPVNLLSNSEFMHSSAFHASMKETAERCIPPTDKGRATEEFGCQYKPNPEAGSYDWVFIKDSGKDPTAMWQALQSWVAFLMRNRLLSDAVGREILSTGIAHNVPGEVLPLSELEDERGEPIPVSRGRRGADDDEYAETFMGEVKPGFVLTINSFAYEQLVEAAKVCDQGQRPYNIHDALSVSLKKRAVGDGFVEGTGCVVSLQLNLVVMPQDTRLL